MGVPITFTGIPPGGWFGEGTVLKREAYRYNIQALRKSVVAGLSVEAFHWLIERSIPFNRFIAQQLNERLGQFIGAREIDRMPDADGRGGSGLGLSVCRQIIENHHGRIRVESAPGRGSIFTLKLPLREEVRARAA